MPTSECYDEDHPQYRGEWCACVLCENSRNPKCPKRNDPCGKCRGPVTNCDAYEFNYCLPDLEGEESEP